MVLNVSGSANNGTMSGLFCANGNNATSNSNRNHGCLLLT